MRNYFQAVCRHLFNSGNKNSVPPIIDLADQLTESSDSDAPAARQLNAAFLISLAGAEHPLFEKAVARLNSPNETADQDKIARFYLTAKDSIEAEIEQTCRQDPDFANRLKELSFFLENSRPQKDIPKVAESTWTVFFPEGLGFTFQAMERIHQLRKKRAVTITRPNPEPIADAAREILFTSNILLTLPSKAKSYEQLNLSDAIKQKILQVSQEPQRYWYDHPIHIGVKPQNNEILHGLRGLDEAQRFERERGTTAPNSRMTCILSASVTHSGLHDVARPYIEEELRRFDGFKNIDVYVFTEDDTQRIVTEILIPAAGYLLKQRPDPKDLNMFGVDGEYGRHYSFLKAVAGFWQVFIQPHVKATFKIDLDQAFPQEILVEKTGASAFEHFMTRLWGARGTDSANRPLELGMIAGALVNEKDIDHSVYTPDVRRPERPLSPDEFLFFSPLPQAISTEAEMMTRYNSDSLDGIKTCIQRVHVTGGTNGIFIDSLLRHRPFTPSFIGRAEDQAYLLSTFRESGESLAYVHEDGLIMRHDKEAFAQEAIDSAEIGRTVGDYLRILYFSAYAGVLPAPKASIKDNLDPFTGCFISKIPVTIAIMRFALKAAALFHEKKMDKGLEVVANGSQRLAQAIEFTHGAAGRLQQQYEAERRGWNMYYDVLDAAAQAIQNNDAFALQMQQNAKAIIDDCRVSTQG